MVRCGVQVYAACGGPELGQWGGGEQVGGCVWPTPGPIPRPASLSHCQVSLLTNGAQIRAGHKWIYIHVLLVKD